MQAEQTEELIHFTIDGKKVSGKKGESVIAVADRYGIYIPRFCYHERLSVVANCRMCLVEVKKAPKTLPACATQIMPDMEVQTRSAATIASQKAVMEFLLVNHPLDCPICDKGGECELQDLAFGFGHGESQFVEAKRSVDDENLGALVATDMTRCIHCTRCIRFGTEIAGIPELGATGRGENMRINTYLERGLQSELSGNCIDVCPVGALTSKPFRFRGRSWGFTQHSSISPHDCIGSNLTIQTVGKGYDKKTEIMRVLPGSNEALNQIWLADRDRFSYEGLHHQERAQNPQMKIHGRWQTVSWEEALTEVAERTMKSIKATGPESVGLALSPSTTLEEGYLLKRIAAFLETQNVDHSVGIPAQNATIDPNNVTTLTDLNTLSTCKTIVLLGSHIRHEQPIATIRIREACQQGAKVYAINTQSHDWNFPIVDNEAVDGQGAVKYMAKVLLAVIKNQKKRPKKAWQNFLQNIKTDARSEALAQALQQDSCFILGDGFSISEHAQTLSCLVDAIKDYTGANVVWMTSGANSRGLHALDMASGKVSEQQNTQPDTALLAEPRKVLWLHQCEPEHDAFDPGGARKTLEESETVVCFTSYLTERMRAYADIIIPVTPFSEMAGSVINALGMKQSFRASQEHLEGCKPAWKCYRVLGNLMGAEGFMYRNIDEVQNELDLVLAENTIIKARQKKPVPTALPSGKGKKMVSIYRPIPLYRVDSIVRRAAALQKAQEDICPPVSRIHPQTAKKLGATLDKEVSLRFADGTKHTVSLCLDDSVALGCVIIPATYEQYENLGARSDWAEYVSGE